MNAVLDASTIITLVKRRGEQAVDALEGSTTLALAPYEIGNALRTETQLTKTLPEQEADRLSIHPLPPSHRPIPRGAGDSRRRHRHPNNHP